MLGLVGAGLKIALGLAAQQDSIIWGRKSTRFRPNSLGSYVRIQFSWVLIPNLILVLCQDPFYLGPASTSNSLGFCVTIQFY